MELVFICSPYRGNIKENIIKAKEYARKAVDLGYIPIVPHLYFPQFLDDNNKKERNLGIEMGLQLLNMCDKIVIIGNPTEGMKQEIIYADNLGMEKIYYEK